MLSRIVSCPQSKAVTENGVLLLPGVVKLGGMAAFPKSVRARVFRSQTPQTPQTLAQARRRFYSSKPQKEDGGGGILGRIKKEIQYAKEHAAKYKGPDYQRWRDSQQVTFQASIWKPCCVFTFFAIFTNIPRRKSY